MSAALRRHRVFDVVMGRSEASLEGYLTRLGGKERVRVVCMDLSSTYRAIVRKHFPQALIVSDRFHVIRLMGHHIHQLWRQIDPSMVFSCEFKRRSESGKKPAAGKRPPPRRIG